MSLKKDPEIKIDFDIGHIFKVHNIVEYKRPDDRLNIDVFAKVVVYVNLYKSQGIPVDSISYNDVSATIYRHAYPRDAFYQLKKYGATIEQAYPGVYYVSGMSPFPIQILVGRQLDAKEYAMLRVLTPGASDEDIRNFKNMAIQNTDALFQKSVDNIFQISISANAESYIRLYKEDQYMCEAMRDLMKEDFDKAEARGETRGKNKNTISLICKKLRKHQSAEMIADALEEDLTAIQKICNMIAPLAPDYDEEKAYELLHPSDDEAISA